MHGRVQILEETITEMLGVFTRAGKPRKEGRVYPHQEASGSFKTAEK